MYCNYRELHSIHWFGFKMGQTSYNPNENTSAYCWNALHSLLMNVPLR